MVWNTSSYLEIDNKMDAAIYFKIEISKILNIYECASLEQIKQLNHSFYLCSSYRDIT